MKMKTKKRKRTGARTYAWGIPDLFYPDPKEVYARFSDDLDVADRLTYYAAALRPYFLSALGQVNEDAEKDQT